MIYMFAHKDFKNLTQYPVVNLANCSFGINDLDGINIHQLNPWINECTGIYWIWKNTNENIIGTCHYRRWLVNNSFPITENELNNYDILTAQNFHLQTSIYDHLKDTHGFDTQLFLNIYDMISNHTDLTLLKELDYMYPFNIFVMNRDLFNQYCKWLFDIIIEPAEILKEKNINSRIVGYFAERLLTIFIVSNQLNVKELQCCNLGG